MANERRPTEDAPEIANYMQGKIKRTAAIKTIYVQDVDKWEAMKAWAEEMGMSVSEAVMAGFELLVNNQCPSCTRIAAILMTASTKAVVKASGSVKVKSKK